MAIEKIRANILWRFVLGGLATLIVYFLILPSNFVVISPGPTYRVDISGKSLLEDSKGEYYYTTVEGRELRNYMAIVKSLKKERIYPDIARSSTTGRGEMLSSSSVAITLGGAIVYNHSLLKDEGVVVLEVFKDSPAQLSGIKSGDVIYSIDKHKLTGINDLQKQISTDRVYELHGRRGNAEILFKVKSVNNKIGVSLSTDTTRLAKPEISIKTESALGGSAGLIFTLAVVDGLSVGSLSNGKKISGTGTITLNGVVGPIEGARYKVASAIRDHYDVFFIPKANFAEVSDINYGIKIVPVETVSDAIKWLCSKGSNDTVCKDYR